MEFSTDIPGSLTVRRLAFAIGTFPHRFSGLCLIRQFSPCRAVRFALTPCNPPLYTDSVITFTKGEGVPSLRVPGQMMYP